MSWYIFKKNGIDDCLRCNNSGQIQVLSYEVSVANKPQLTESIYVCNCSHAIDIRWTRDEYVRDDSGKRVKKTLSDIVSARFDDLFSRLQFPWNEQIMKSREPWIDYQEVYLACKIITQREFLKTGKPEILINWDYINNQADRQKGGVVNEVLM